MFPWLKMWVGTIQRSSTTARYRMKNIYMWKMGAVSVDLVIYRLDAGRGTAAGELLSEASTWRAGGAAGLRPAVGGPVGNRAGRAGRVRSARRPVSDVRIERGPWRVERVSLPAVRARRASGPRPSRSLCCRCGHAGGSGGWRRAPGIRTGGAIGAPRRSRARAIRDVGEGRRPRSVPGAIPEPAATAGGGRPAIAVPRVAAGAVDAHRRASTGQDRPTGRRRRGSSVGPPGVPDGSDPAAEPAPGRVHPVRPGQLSGPRSAAGRSFRCGYGLSGTATPRNRQSGSHPWPGWYSRRRSAGTSRRTASLCRS
ncbi:hypothetical protein GA0070618_3599 [Micromonospora echinospora]|uniref:Uncharacterized protein n=1 Tax=Micromonospora echinospora TaxID=1877 RepID=A0A1C4Y552_MICEC|nr:hypothetical protein GA0070618_3599 [Micromonospora echinospora]